MISPLCPKTLPKAPFKPIFAIEVPVYEPVLSEQQIQRLQTALKNLPGLDFRMSWTLPEMTQDATQDQAGVKESSSSAPE
ncbi:hypothetical protein [Acaryochloris marina]|uniref:hypothetical protein n=1 Tax=Acaryochloris marina TaxID=155978 RepID=UPI001BB0C543|nr:hypothetical protein [Acaryochloris marina]QUY45571.1 hypothetical protein I1H34_27875 [Acaryochloris marina S15]